MKPFVVELDYTRPDLGKPHWNFYIFGWSVMLLGVLSLVSAFFVSEDRVLPGSLGLVAWQVGLSLCLLGRFVRETHASRTESNKLAAEQDARIRELEAQVAVLTAALSPTHEHAA